MYFGKNLYTSDPVIKAATQRTTHFTTQEIRSQTSSKKPSRKQRWLYALERRFGFVHDIYIPIHTPLRIQVFYAYFQGNDSNYPDKLNRLLPQLKHDVAIFAASAVDFFIIGEHDESIDILFSIREQECLAWMAKGRSNIDIAKILNITERTVKFHVKNIMHKLSADNRTEAVAIAARSGWIIN